MQVQVVAEVLPPALDAAGCAAVIHLRELGVREPGLEVPGPHVERRLTAAASRGCARFPFLNHVERLKQRRVVEGRSRGRLPVHEPEPPDEILRLFSDFRVRIPAQLVQCPVEFTRVLALALFVGPRRPGVLDVILEGIPNPRRVGQADGDAHGAFRFLDDVVAMNPTRLEHSLELLAADDALGEFVQVRLTIRILSQRDPRDEIAGQVGRTGTLDALDSKPGFVVFQSMDPGQIAERSFFEGEGPQLLVFTGRLHRRLSVDDLTNDVDDVLECGQFLFFLAVEDTVAAIARRHAKNSQLLRCWGAGRRPRTAALGRAAIRQGACMASLGDPGSRERSISVAGLAVKRNDYAACWQSWRAQGMG